MALVRPQFQELLDARAGSAPLFPVAHSYPPPQPSIQLWNRLIINGLITQPSTNSVEVTIEKFEAAAEERGLKIFARLDHAAAAESVGLEMPAATVIVFGNPRIGTPTFIETPTVAIDLPPKAMVWEDAEGNVFLSYNSADFLFNTIYARHGLPADETTIANVASTYAAIADAAIN